MDVYGNAYVTGYASPNVANSDSLFMVLANYEAYYLTMKYNASFSCPTIIEKSNQINCNLPIPTEFILNQNYPNPFNPYTTIKYGIPYDGFTSIKIYDVLGR